MSDVTTAQSSALAALEALASQLRAEINADIAEIQAEREQTKLKEDLLREKQMALGRVENKPGTITRSPDASVITRGRRGRKPGSKNKPRVQQTNGPVMYTTQHEQHVEDDWDNTRPAAE